MAVSSVVGEGSTFSAVLPRSMGLAPLEDVTPVVEFPHDNRTVLVVDDDQITLKLVETVLRESGYRTVSSDDAANALLLVQLHQPAVVIVDLVMPDVDGFEFIARLRAMPEGRSLPIVVWTVKDLDADERRRLQSAAVTVISKRSGGPHTLVEALFRIAPAMPMTAEGTHGI